VVFEIGYEKVKNGMIEC